MFWRWPTVFTGRSARTSCSSLPDPPPPPPATHPVPDKLYDLCGRKTPCLLTNPVVVCEGEREIGISRTCVSETVLFCFVIFTPVIVSFSREAPSFDLHTCRSCLKSGYKGSWGGFSRFCLLTMTAIDPAPTQISLAGAATSMIFVCRDKHVFVATKTCLSRQSTSFVATKVCLSRQT